MGGDDSQKLLPRRGVHSSPGAQTSGSTNEINNITDTCGWTLQGRSLDTRAMASATARLGHFWKAQVGQFWRAPKRKTAEPLRLISRRISRQGFTNSWREQPIAPAIRHTGPKRLRGSIAESVSPSR